MQPSRGRVNHFVSAAAAAQSPVQSVDGPNYRGKAASS